MKTPSVNARSSWRWRYSSPRRAPGSGDDDGDDLSLSLADSLSLSPAEEVAVAAAAAAAAAAQARAVQSRCRRRRRRLRLVGHLEREVARGDSLEVRHDRAHVVVVHGPHPRDGRERRDALVVQRDDRPVRRVRGGSSPSAVGPVAPRRLSRHRAAGGGRARVATRGTTRDAREQRRRDDVRYARAREHNIPRRGARVRDGSDARADRAVGVTRFSVSSRPIKRLRFLGLLSTRVAEPRLRTPPAARRDPSAPHSPPQLWFTIRSPS